MRFGANSRHHDVTKWSNEEGWRRKDLKIAAHRDKPTVQAEKREKGVEKHNMHSSIAWLISMSLVPLLSGFSNGILSFLDENIGGEVGSYVFLFCPSPTLLCMISPWTRELEQDEKNTARSKFIGMSTECVCSCTLCFVCRPYRGGSCSSVFSDICSR